MAKQIQYALNIRQTLENYYKHLLNSRNIYIAVLLFFLLNYSLLIVGKLLVGSYFWYGWWS